MKNLLFLIVVCFSVFCFNSCKDLDRDNPLDLNQGRTEANITFSKYEVYSDNNNDDQINKGESIKLKVYLKNNGSSTANKVRATITTNSSYITSLSNSTSIGYYYQSNYDYITAGGEGEPYSSNYFLGFNVSNTTPSGTVITFNVSITDESNNAWNSSFNITVEGTGANITFSKYEVYSDSNNDDQINKGESIKLKVYLKACSKLQFNYYSIYCVRNQC